MNAAIRGLCALLVAASVPGAAVCAEVVGQGAGLVAHYCFENEDSLTQDCKGQDHGQVIGGSLQSVPAWRGRGVRLVPLPGQTARLVVPNSRRLQFKDGLTFMLAVRPDPLSRNQLMVKGSSPPIGPECFGRGVGDWAPPLLAFAIQVRSRWTYGGGTDFHLGLVNTGPECYSTIGFQPWPHFVDGHWTHVAVTASVITGRVETYLNGAHRPEASGGGFTSEIMAAMNAADMTLAESLSGAIDEVKVFNRALSADEVKSQFHLAGLAQPIDAMRDGSHMAAVSDLCFFAGTCGRSDARLGLAGVDYKAAPGTPVSAICTGRVDRVEQPTDAARRLVRVRHTGSDCGPVKGGWAYYGHVDARADLVPGATVHKGQVLGTVALWEDGTGVDLSRLHLAVNRSVGSKRWGRVDTGVVTNGSCGPEDVMPRRAGLVAQGWVDVLDLGAENGWMPVQRVPDCYGDDYPRAHVPTPFGNGLPYHPFEERP